MENSLDFIKKQTDKCVYCGLCSDICPTYKYRRHEAESPRGRVIAMKHVVYDTIQIDRSYQEHIYNCLQCASCDNVCPMQIPISKLVAHSKNIYTSGLKKNYLYLTDNVSRLNILFRFGIKNLLLPKAMRVKFYGHKSNPQKDHNEATLAFFTGCTGNNFDIDTKNAFINLCRKLGINIAVPKKQNCCGALHYHAGDFKSFAKHQKENSKTLQNSNIKEYIYSVSGCAHGLQSIHESTLVKVTELIDFLAKIDWHSTKFKPLDATIAIHIACSYKDKPATRARLKDILGLIPNLKFEFLGSEYACCGNAGMHMLKNPQVAKDMRKPLIEKINKSKYSFIASASLPCRLHISRGKIKNNAKIVHPVFLLNQQLHDN